MTDTATIEPTTQVSTYSVTVVYSTPKDTQVFVRRILQAETGNEAIGLAKRLVLHERPERHFVFSDAIRINTEG